jgi:hypothetical protein
MMMTIAMAISGAQAQTVTEQCAIRGDYHRAVLDNLGNLYTVRGSEVLRFDARCQQMYRYSDLMAGKVDHIDASNPLKILLFYRDFSKVIFLDNTLTPSGAGVIDLRNLGLSLATLACTSFDNGMWVYDAVNYRLVRFNQSMGQTSEVTGIDLIIGRRISPVHMAESADHLFLYDPDAGLFIFDVFGSYLRSLPTTGAEQFVAYGDLMMFRTRNHVHTFDLERLTEGGFDLSGEQVKWFDARKGQMAVTDFLGTTSYKLSN